MDSCLRKIHFAEESMGIIRNSRAYTNGEIGGPGFISVTPKQLLSS